MSSVNMSSLMAARNAILNQNNALQNIANKSANLSGIGPGVQTGQVSGPGGPGSVGGLGGVEGSRPPGGAFAAQLTDAIQEVNKLQATAKENMTAYQMGETNDVAAVMLSKHKASIGFESTLQARNKLLSAYKDIMNMPV